MPPRRLPPRRPNSHFRRPDLRVPIEDSFDLHSFRPEEAIPALADYLDEARLAGFREVRIVHGRGRGVRRAEVHRALAARADVLEAHDAPPERGGFGATVVVFR